MHRYRYCGRTLTSAIPLPELPEASGREAADLVVRERPVPDRLATSRYRCATWEIGEGEALWRLDGVARFRIGGGGRCIDVQPDRRAHGASVRLFLLHPVFCLAAVLRGDWLLEAAAVAAGARGIAIAGLPSAGKSTLAAALVRRRGHRLLSDGLLRLQAVAGGVYGSAQAPWSLLRADARARLSVPPGEAVRPGHDLARCLMPALGQAAPLSHVVVLTPSPDGEFGARRLSPVDALGSLRRCTAGGVWIERAGRRTEHFRWTARVGAACSVWEVHWPAGGDHLEQAFAEWIEAL